MKKREAYKELTDEMLLRIAHIIGPNSAARRALEEKCERVLSGESDCTVYCVGDSLIVGPRIAPNPD